MKRLLTTLSFLIIATLLCISDVRVSNAEDYSWSLDFGCGDNRKHGWFKINNKKLKDNKLHVIFRNGAELNLIHENSSDTSGEFKGSMSWKSGSRRPIWIKYKATGSSLEGWGLYSQYGANTGCTLRGSRTVRMANAKRKAANTNGQTPYTDKRVCSEALVETPLSGIKWGHAKYNWYVAIAKKRGLSLEKCAHLTGRRSLLEIARNKAESRRKEEQRAAEALQKRQAAAATARRKAEAERLAAEAKRMTKAQQVALQRLGLYDGAIDGIAGPKTNKALRGWQTSRGYSGDLTEQQTAELIQAGEQSAATPKSVRNVAKAITAQAKERQTEALRLAEEAKRQVAEEKRKREAAERRLPELQAKEAARQAAEAKPKPVPKTSASTTGSGFFVSKTGHVITNQHVVGNCKKVTVGDKADKQVEADILEMDRRNDLALLKISSLKMASTETKSLIQKLGIEIVPLASAGLLRSDDLELGEDVLVAGYPYGEIFSDTIKVTKGIVSANRGLGDDTGQFQIDAAVQPGNSGGPIYDENGNVVGVVISQLNKMKFAKMSGSLPENVNFGIKASTVRQFLSSSGLPTKWSDKSEPMSTKELAKIAKRQTVMVVCQK